MSDRFIIDKKEDGKSLSRQVFEKLQKDILEGKYQTNEKMVEMTLSKELGVSRTPIREALRQLELEGLVVLVPNKGIYVNNITQKDVEDIYIIRGLIEEQCAKWACDNINEKQLAELEEVVYLSQFYYDKGDFESLLSLDNKFHLIMYEASGSKILKNFLTDLHKYVVRARRSSLRDLSRAKESIKEHRQILDMIKKGDKEKVSQLVRNHVNNSHKSVKQKLEA